MSKTITRDVIEMKDVQLVYKTGSKEVQALKDINLTIEEGSFVCVLGPSGCGKTTLLRLIAGFLGPTGGEILLDGKPMPNKPDRHRGVVFQQHTLYPWLNIEQNVAFGLKMRKIPGKERLRLVDEYIDMVGLSHFKKSYPHELSGGMRQRASLARVLVNDPRIVLLDEPLGALDAITKSQMQVNIREIWKKTHKTCFFITHDVEEALLLATHIVIMSNRPGKIVKVIENSIPYEIEGQQDENHIYGSDFIRKREEIVKLITD